MSARALFGRRGWLPKALAGVGLLTILLSASVFAQVSGAPTPAAASPYCYPCAQVSVTATSNLASGTSPLTVSFSGSATGGTAPYSFLWTFGDGQTSTTQNPTHSYTQPGTYTASLTVTDSAGNSAQSSAITITVSSGGGGSSPQAVAGLSAPDFALLIAGLIVAAVIAIAVVLLIMQRRRAPPVMAAAAGGYYAGGYYAAAPAVDPTSLEPPAEAPSADMASYPSSAPGMAHSDYPQGVPPPPPPPA